MQRQFRGRQFRSVGSPGGTVRLCPAGILSLKTGGAKGNSTARGPAVYRLLSHVAAADDVVLTVARVAFVFVRTAGCAGFAFRVGSVDVERLVDRAEGGSDVFEFVVDSVGDFSKTDDDSENRDRGNQNQLSRNNEAGFVVDQLCEDVRHGVLSFVVAGLK